ncbi:MAG TPA: choice-of-anchor Q domain-containing protein, partial [Acidimicrobiales bacterium]|nr:choice-of-anchor Q domain-containing protein [Acidimicrobiales bacterium]
IVPTAAASAADASSFTAPTEASVAAATAPFSHINDVAKAHSSEGNGQIAPGQTAPSPSTPEAHLLPANPPPIAGAPVLTVDTTVDAHEAVSAPPGTCSAAAPATEGSCTLRAAIETANAAGTAFAIIVPAGTYSLNLGVLDITDPGGVTITGDSQLTTIIDGSGQVDRVFQLTGNGPQAQMSNLTISGGAAPTGLGATDPGYGGGISVLTSSASLVLNSVTVSNNAASKGGAGIENFGRLWTTNSTLAGNVVTGAGTGFVGGGGMVNELTGSVNLANSSVIANTVTGTGVASGSVFSGGGVINFGTLAVNGGFINQNRIDIPASTDSNNPSDGEGAGITVVGPTTLTDLTVTGNSAGPATAAVNTTATGGGINAAVGLSTVAGSTITDNTVVSDTTTSGGGIAIQSGLVGITGTQITGNTSSVTNACTCGGTVSGGGGVATVQGGSVAIASSTITGNTATATSTGSTAGAGGGGVLLLTGTSVINSSTISGNTAGLAGAANSTGDGGGVMTLNPALGGLIIQRSKVMQNTAINGFGGGIVSFDMGATTVQGDTISGNSATGTSGAFLAGIGGGLFGSGTTSITTTTFDSNHADTAGGGLLEGSGGVVTGDTISNNTASIGAGMIVAPFGFGGSPTQVVNSTFAGNVASTAGGGIAATGTTTDLNYSTVTLNQAPNGSGVNVGSGSLNVTGSIVSGNTGADCKGSGAGSVLSSSGYNLLGSSCTNTPAPTDLVGVDAMLAPLADNGGPTQTVALLPGSPALNAGGGPTCPATDQRGETRPQGNACDIGAFESANSGYWLVAADGGIFAFGDAGFFGSQGGQPLNKPVVGMASTPDGKGYWLVAADGGIFTFGDAGFFGSEGGHKLTRPIVGMAATPDGHGYWLTAANGSVFAFGDAGTFGDSSGQGLNAPIRGIARTPSGKGYTQVAADGGVFAFGNAGFFGSKGGQPLNAPITGLAGTNDGQGYWLFAADGGVFTFGDAGFFGSMGGQALNKPVVGGATPG